MQAAYHGANAWPGLAPDVDWRRWTDLAGIGSGRRRSGARWRGGRWTPILPTW